MNIIKYNFEKNLNKNSDIYSLEIYLPLEFQKFSYKIYGDKGLIELGSLQIYRNHKLNNILTIPVNIIQTIFITICYTSNSIEKEYFDFVDLKELLEGKNFLKKNITLNIIKQENKTNEEIDDDEEEVDDEEGEEADAEDEDTEDEEDDSDEDDDDKK